MLVARQALSGGASLRVLILAHALVRIAGSAGGVAAGAWLASSSANGPPIRASFVGALSASSLGAELIASVPFGLAADVVPVRLLTSSGALLGAFAIMLFGLSAAAPALLLSRILEGLATAAVTPPLLRYLAAATTADSRQRARSMSLFELSLLAGVALGGLVGAQLWAHTQRHAFAHVAALYVLAAMLFALAPAGGRAGARSALKGVGVTLQNPAVRHLAPVWLCVNAIVGVWLGPTLSFVLTERATGGRYLDGRFATAPAELGWALLGYTLIFGTGVFIWGRLLPRIGSLRTMLIGLRAMLGVCATLVLLNHSLAWPSWTRVLLVAAAALFILIESGFGPATLYWLAGSLGPGAGAGATMGVYSFLLTLGAMGGSLLGGWSASHWRMDGMIGATTVLALIGLGFLQFRSQLRESVESGRGVEHGK